MFRIEIHAPTTDYDDPTIQAVFTDLDTGKVGTSTTRATENSNGRAMVTTCATLPYGHSWYTSTTCDPNVDGNTAGQVRAELMQHVAQTITLPGDPDTVLSVLHAMLCGARADW